MRIKLAELFCLPLSLSLSVSFYPSRYLFIYLSIYLIIYLPIYLSISLSIYLSAILIKDRNIDFIYPMSLLYYLSLSPFLSLPHIIFHSLSLSLLFLFFSLSRSLSLSSFSHHFISAFRCIITYTESTATEDFYG